MEKYVTLLNIKAIILRKNTLYKCKVRLVKDLIIVMKKI